MRRALTEMEGRLSRRPRCRAQGEATRCSNADHPRLPSNRWRRRRPEQAGGVRSPDGRRGNRRPRIGGRGRRRLGNKTSDEKISNHARPRRAVDGRARPSPPTSAAFPGTVVDAKTGQTMPNVTLYYYRAPYLENHPDANHIMKTGDKRSGMVQRRTYARTRDATSLWRGFRARSKAARSMTSSDGEVSRDEDRDRPRLDHVQRSARASGAGRSERHRRRLSKVTPSA